MHNYNPTVIISLENNEEIVSRTRQPEVTSKIGQPTTHGELENIKFTSDERKPVGTY